MNFSCLEAKTTCNFKSFMLKSFPWSVELYEGIKPGIVLSRVSLFSRSEEQQHHSAILVLNCKLHLKGWSLPIFSTFL